LWQTDWADLPGGLLPVTDDVDHVDDSREEDWEENRRQVDRDLHDRFVHGFIYFLRCAESSV
jgi:hypothetical protein